MTDRCETFRNCRTTIPLSSLSFKSCNIPVVAELVALYSWLLLWLVAYFDPSFKALKRHLRVQESTFCCNSTDSFTLKDWHIAAIFTHSATHIHLLYITNVCDKLPILLHWLYICD